ncbi:MAG: transketolase [Firmicutes bacterium]|nr:transketolase [Bacillota bacterium]
MKAIEQKAINTIRMLAVDAIEKAKSGHPGLPMGGAPMAYTLWTRCMQHSPSDPQWPNRDRFVLSAGHGSMLLYALLHLFGYGLTLDDLKAFRQWGSLTPGHPEYGHTVGVETTTGPLGQGFANAVGMAIAEARLAAEFNKPGFEIVHHYTYVYCGDGCLMEGVSAEAASLAGHLKLGRLICLYDDNQITIDGSTEITFTEDVAKRFEAYGWHVLKVKDGNDIEEIALAIEKAKQETERPSLIMVRTAIGYGSPNKQGSAAVHGAPLGAEEVKLTKENLGWPTEPDFYVPAEVREHFAAITAQLEKKKAQWDELFAQYRREYPEAAAAWDAWHAGDIPAEVEEDKSLWQFAKPLATRAASGQVMQIIAKYLSNLMGGSADLNASTNTYLKGLGDFQADNRKGNNLFFGVREHAMGSIANGMALHGGLRPFVSTFFVFVDYMKPPVRLAALMGLPVIYVFTHDSIGVGEDGPTHQPIEQLAGLRSTPNLHVFRPADGRETAAAWLAALKRKDGPTAIILTRQTLPQLEGTGVEAAKGAYVLAAEKGEVPDLILIATGSEVQLALQAQKVLAEKDIDARVVSMPSWELFKAQPAAYRQKVLPENVRKRIAIEAGHSMGWQQFTGDEGLIISIDHFGVSAPGEILMQEFGFTVENIVQKALALLQRS